MDCGCGKGNHGGGEKDGGIVFWKVSVCVTTII